MKNLPTFLFLFNYFTLEQGSANFSGEDQIVNTLGFMSHIVFLILNSAIFTKTGGRLDLVHGPQLAL